MKSFVKIDENNKVIDSIVIPDVDDGQEYILNLELDGKWIETFDGNDLSVGDYFDNEKLFYGFIKTENLHNIDFLDVAEKVVYNSAGDMFMISWEGEIPSALPNILEYATDLDGAMIYEKEVFNGN